MWGLVVLQRALIDDLITGGQGDAEHLAVRAFAEKIADALASAELGTELDLEVFHLRIACGDGAGEMHCLRFVAKLLTGDVADAAAFASNEIGHGKAEASLGFQGAVVIDDGDIGVVLGDDKRVREDGGVLGGDPVEDFDRLLDGDAFWHENDESGTNVGQMQRSELGGAEGHLALHEVLLQECGLGLQRFFEWQADHACGQSVGFGDDEAVVDEDEACGGFGEA